MSLALRAESRVGDGSGPASPVVPSAGARVLGTIDFRQIARRAALPPAIVPQSATPTPPRTALELLAEVSEALPAVLARCRALEAALATSRETGRAELEAANEVIREWQGIAETTRAQLEAADDNATALRHRAEAAEATLEVVRGDVDRAQQAAAEAECLSSLFEEKVMAAFGVGTPGHSIMESVRNRTQQMLSA